MFVKKLNFFYFVVEGGKLVFKYLWEVYCENDFVKVNRIFEFRVGMIFRFGNEMIIVFFLGRFIVLVCFESIRIYIEFELKLFFFEIG